MENKSIEALSNFECCGCGLCVAICPSSSIHLVYNDMGFYRATVDEKQCTDCGLCQPVCFKFQDRYPLDLNEFMDVYTAANKNETVRLASPSGGVGTALAETVMDLGFKVIGARLNASSMDLKHIVVLEKKDLDKIRGSKYFQSYTPDAFKAIKKHEKLLVFGTPCQISGIRKAIFERKGFEHIILVDFKCAGVESRLLVDMYFEHRQREYQAGVSKVNLRYKFPTWANYSVKIDFDDGSTYKKINYFDELMEFHRTAACISDFCASCELFKNFSHADIRIEDAWDFVPLNPSDYKKGVNTVVTFTEKGTDLFERAKPKLYFKKRNIDYSFKPVIKRQNKPEIMALLKQNLSLEEFVRQGKDLESKFFKRWRFKAFLKIYFGKLLLPVYCFLQRKKANTARRKR